MTTSHMRLENSMNHKKFVDYLEKIERTDRVSNGILTNWEREFVTSMRESFDGREDQQDLGVTPWSPTVNQWNTLHGIWSKL